MFYGMDEEKKWMSFGCKLRVKLILFKIFDGNFYEKLYFPGNFIEFKEFATQTLYGIHPVCRL